ncbi:hypothetical protein SAMN04487765_2318 [Tenacibaculum sp. MAR_2010_89]|uniref:NUDIX hydrolase n=1 Tax=Tenacibaculum sp. MAR_2010_89 TaxID=1250198 RepID=UPI000894E04E|nr:NUDIX hydrolase [Tenacibaculum sp. MAR_2010_89]SEE37215.1 hypothetical protein SAMN04487765_2318 [Tenacibaculum sp. MAR_2010_89]
MKIILLIVLFLISAKIVGQSEVVSTNYSFFKLIITNNKKEILLVKWGDSWEIQGRKYKGNYSLYKFIERMGDGVGAKIKKIKLRGLFTFHYKGRVKPTLMHYYQASYKSGDLKIPKSCSDIRWFSLVDAMKVIEYSDMKAIMKQLKGNDKVWGGALEITTKSENNERMFKKIDDFYELN